MTCVHQQSSITDEHSDDARRIAISYEITVSEESQTKATIAAHIVLPRNELIDTHQVILCCVPGGGSSWRYFDLEVEGDSSYSFAEFAAKQGLITIAVDNLGTGSSCCFDSAAITPHQVAQANSTVFRAIAEQLRVGGLQSDIPALPNISTVGIGHSMGGMLTVLGQSREPLHSAIATLGFSLDGLPEQLTQDELALISSPDRWNEVLKQLATERFATAPQSRSNAPRFPFYLESTPEYARRALTHARTNILPLPGLLSMIPGNVREDAERVTTPVFLGGGDHEPWHTPAAAVGAFANSSDITFYKLEGAAHNHNVAEGRMQLWKRLCQWSIGVSGGVPLNPTFTESGH